MSRLRDPEIMTAKLEKIRSAAERVAASHGLELVDIELVGPSKERTLRVYLEKNAEGRAKLKAAIEAAAFAKSAREEDEDVVDAVLDESATDESVTGEPEADLVEESSEVTEDLPVGLTDGRVKLEQLSGITHQDCTAFSRDFGVLLDVEDLVPGAEYTLEASSPGLDRKLTKPEDFARFAGCLVKIQTFEAIRNNRHWQGRLIARPDSQSSTEAPVAAVTLDLSAVKQNSKSRKSGVNTVEIALENIEKAQLVPEI
jgi:ribosome maturation factor RimP